MPDPDVVDSGGWLVVAVVWVPGKVSEGTAGPVGGSGVAADGGAAVVADPGRTATVLAEHA